LIQPNRSRSAVNAIGYAEFYSRSHDAVFAFTMMVGNVIETHKHVGDLWKAE